MGSPWPNPLEFWNKCVELELMADIYFTNSLSGKKEKFEAIKPPCVGIYTCGPTVYDYPTIGNWRTYILSDLIVRILKYNGYQIDYVMNFTDVGHLTGDNSGDADTGEDRLEKAAKRERKTAWDVANYYIKDFKESFAKLNLTPPKIFCRATEHIGEQIVLIKKLEEKGLTYKIDDGIYFDVSRYEKLGNQYGELSTLDKIKAGARVETNPQKKDPRDFALWKFSSKDKKRDMEWDSPWGIGFPGWHLECSAMSMKYLGERFDIHIGGEDLRSTHHPNEIAQSEGATEKKPFVKYWIHGAFLLVDGKRMGKSVGNAYNLHDIEEKKFNSLDLRYFYLTGHYRKQINFTREALNSAKTALLKLRELLKGYKKEDRRTTLSQEKLDKTNQFRIQFDKAISDDLNMPQALSTIWEVVKSNIPDYDKYDLVESFDEVLGLNLNKISDTEYSVSSEAKELVNQRVKLREMGKFDEADEIRKEIEKLGYRIEDTDKGPKIKLV